MTTTVTKWKHAHAFTSEMGHNIIQIDGSRENGFGPKALLLSGLAGCSGIDVVDILQKMRVEFSVLEIEVAAEQTEEHPKVYKNIHIHYKVKTATANEDKVRKAIELSLEKYCGVSAMLQKTAGINFQLSIIS